MYNGSACTATDGSGVYDCFEIKTGVKQDFCCCFLFLLVMDWVMRNARIRWKFSSLLEDLDFADGLSLVSSKREHIQTKVDSLGHYGKMTGLKINTTKTMMMMWSSPISEKVQVDFEELTGGATVGRKFRIRHQRPSLKSEKSIQ